MLYVVDASVVLKWFLPEAHREKADALLNDFRLQRLDLLAPDLLVAEVRNTLWKRSVLRNEISPSDAEELYSLFLNLQLPLVGSFTLAKDAFRVAQQAQHSFYDALYIALALRNNCELITADESLVRKLGNRFPIRSLAEL